MEYAAFSADPTIIRTVRQNCHSSASSVSSSIRSSIDSVFSQASSPRTSACFSTAASPIFSSCSHHSSEDDDICTHKRIVSAPSARTIKPAPLRIKKKVSFSLQRPLVLSQAQLDLTDDSAIIDAFPSPPTGVEDPPYVLTPSRPQRQPRSRPGLPSGALIRYRGHLSDLHAQINYHISSVNSQIATLHSTRKARRSNLPTIFTGFGQGGMGGGVSDNEMKKARLRARIERLKENGWKRERFDGSKYQLLCERAMREFE